MDAAVDFGTPFRAGLALLVAERFLGGRGPDRNGPFLLCKILLALGILAERRELLDA